MGKVAGIASRSKHRWDGCGAGARCSILQGRAAHPQDSHVPCPCPCPGTTPHFLLSCIWGRCTGTSHRQFCSQTTCIRILLSAVILAAHQHVTAILAPRSALSQAPAALQETQLLETPSQFLVQWVRPRETTTTPLSNSSCPAGVSFGMLAVLHGCHQGDAVDKFIC